MKLSWKLFNPAWLPFIVIGAVFLWSVVLVATRQHASLDPNQITVRIAHWQLEPGVREALNEAAITYKKLHPDVTIVQESIPEGIYGQWLSTQLMGHTAPDIVQMGMLSESQMTAFNARYIVPVTPLVSRPNPYNAGTDLEGVPLIRTLKDGMRGSYNNQLQEFVSMPVALASIRLYYNKTLLKKLTGRDEAPADFRGFIQVCDEILKTMQPNGRSYIPIAGSSYHYTKGWENSLILPLSYTVFQEVDFNHDGLFSKDEMFLGFLSGKIDFSNPALHGMFRMIPEITRFFPHGWTGLNRDEVIFSFAQQKAVFISTGIWEVEGIRQQAEGKFELGIMDFPLPLKSDPEYGGIIRGPRYENPDGNMPFSVVNTSKHQDVAFDFLLFLTSQKQNESFNRHIKWIPIVKGARLAAGIEIFEPKLEGVFPAFEAGIGPESQIKWLQMYSLYQIGQISYADMTKEFTAFYVSNGVEDFKEGIRNTLRGQVRRAQFACGLRAFAFSAGTDQGSSEWLKYRLANESLILSEGRALKAHGYLDRLPQLRNEALYRYSPEALDNIRQSALKTKP